MKRLLAITLALIALVTPGQAYTKHRRHHAHQPASSASSIRVWVNLRTGIYHYPGERWYGRTVDGQYMTERAAIAAGYRATENGQ